MPISEALDQSQPGLVRRVTNAIRNRQLNQRTEQTYLHWITRFVLFHNLQDPATLAEDDQQRFLAYLRDGMRLSRARLNQARQALQFFYADVLEKPVPGVAVA